MEFVTNIIQNSVAGFVDSGVRTAGGYAGDFLNKAGDFIESSGVAYGNGISNKFDTWGTSISGIGPSKVPLTRSKTTVAAASRPKALKRSNSSPATSKPKPKTTTPAPKKPSTTLSRTQSTPTTTKPATKAKTGTGGNAEVSKTGLKYTPGVVTGMAKAGGGRAAGKVGGQGQGGKKGGNSANSVSAGAGAGAKYTKGVVTGMGGKKAGVKA